MYYHYKATLIKKAYLGETWNRLDMFIVVAGFASAALRLFPSSAIVEVTNHISH